jgi:hypothetical protein
MKLFLTSLLLTLVVVKAGVAQTDPCKGKQFLYEFIDPTAPGCPEKYECSENPNAHPAPLVPVKWRPGVIKYSTNNLTVGLSSCVDATALDKCIDRAFCMWLGQCPSCGISANRVPPNPGDFTIVPIVTSTDRNTFGDNNHDISGIIAQTRTLPLCDGSLGNYRADIMQRIFINASSDYTTANTDVYPCNSNLLIGKCKGDQSHSPTDLCEAITHEIGHLLGLNHTFGPQPKGSPDDCNGSYSPGDVMYYSISGDRLGKSNNCNGHDPKLTANDECMFRKLYCPDNHDPLRADKSNINTLTMICGDSYVDPENYSAAFDAMLSAYPNPTSGALEVEFTSKRAGTVTISIFNILGAQVMSKIFPEQPGRAIHSLSLASLSSGHYILRVQGVEIRGSKLIDLIDR